jgi:hypothetical protein
VTPTARALSLRQLADDVGLSARTLAHLRRSAPDALPSVAGAAGTFELAPCVRALRRLTVERSEAEAVPGDFESARTRKITAEAELAEIEVGKARGEVVSVADYGTALGRILDREMARLRALPVRLSHLGAEVETAAEREVERMIVEMSQFDDDVIDAPDHHPRSQT